MIEDDNIAARHRFSGAAPIHQTPSRLMVAASLLLLLVILVVDRCAT